MQLFVEVRRGRTVVKKNLNTFTNGTFRFCLNSNEVFLDIFMIDLFGIERYRNGTWEMPMADLPGCCPRKKTALN